MITVLALILALTLASTGAPQAVSTSALIDRVDRTFASMKDFSAEFIQISTNPVNQKQRDEGHLYLTKDKKMRWEYRKSEEKLFVSNGKTLYSYYPLNREVTKEQVKNNMAERIPIMFLVGRAGLKNEFTDFKEDPAAKPAFEGNRVVRFSPKRKNEGIERIEIEVDPRTNFIARMVIMDTDKSSNELIFMNIEVNSNLPASQFEFTPPKGTRIIQGEAIQ